MNRHPNVAEGEISNGRANHTERRSHTVARGWARRPGTPGSDVACTRSHRTAKHGPRHYHFADEEAAYILEGRGTVRIGDREIEVSTGDYIALPAGEETAHRIFNDSDASLRYLCFSTTIEPDIAAYPDSGKLELFAGSAPGGQRDRWTLKTFLTADAEMDYYDGEN